MTNALINFNRARKERARAAAKEKAEENTVRFGRTKARKEIERADAERAKRRLDGHERAERPEQED